MEILHALMQLLFVQECLQTSYGRQTNLLNVEVLAIVSHTNFFPPFAPMLFLATML